jgi:hypothetical protein
VNKAQALNTLLESLTACWVKLYPQQKKLANMKIPGFDLMKNISGHLDKLVKYPQILRESTESPVSRRVCKFQTQTFLEKFKTSN